MAITKIEISNFTVFGEFSMDVSPGINVIIGENGTGKTHLLKLIYSKKQGDKKESKKQIDFYDYFLTKETQHGKNVLESEDKAHKIVKDFLNKNGNKPLSSLIEDEDSVKKLKTIMSDHAFMQETISIQKINISESRTSPMILIPAKEILSHSKGFMSLWNDGKLEFDKTYYDIISKSLLPVGNKIPTLSQKILPTLEKILNAKIVIKDDVFYTSKNDGTLVNFSVEAEGVKKLGLLWQLLMNGSIEKESVLLWDEPEANLNPVHIPVVVDMLLELQRAGVQIFVSTHDYIFAKYFEVKRTNEDFILFHSLYKYDMGINCETNQNFRDLKNNPIISSFDKLLDEVYFKNLG